jgi:asparagine synthase (glutamine-hydrolysing)
MCGICGYVGTDVANTPIQRMVETLNHRGPDSSGVWEDLGVAIGHTRLAIIDLSDGGNQPMASDEGRYTLVFNGEIYNYRELRRELETQGEHFRSASDTEVLLLGYRRWSRGLLARLRGMFAFGIWDNHLRHLFLARDRIGIKPLFYAALEDGLVFASEIKALLHHPAVVRDLNPSAVHSYLTLGFIPGPETIFKGIRALMPGSYLEWCGGRLRTEQYWTPDFTATPLPEKEKDLVEELDVRLNDAVKTHLVADVPVGVFLSGGIDSSLIAALAQRLSPEPLRTFTIGFAGGGDERHFGRAVAAHIGSRHEERLVTPESVAQLPRLLWFLEQPLYDNSKLPTYLVSQFARAYVKVVLSGDGGDEPFVGYDWTRFAIAFPEFDFAWSPSGWQWAYQTGVRGLTKRLLYDVTHKGNSRYLRRMTVPRSLIHWLYTEEFADLAGRSEDGFFSDTLREAPVRDTRDRFPYTDLRIYLPEDVLFKVDRMSMANSLEVRVPLLDHNLLEWLLRLPFSMRFRRGHGKYLLRKVAARYLPPLILKPRKQGFTVPIERWLHSDLGGLVERVFKSQSFRDRGIIRPEAALTLLAMHQGKRFDLGHRIWCLLILEVWSRVWLDDRKAEDFQTLLD